MLRAEGTPEAEQPWGKTDGTVTAVRFGKEGDEDQEELPGEGQDALPGVEEVDEVSATSAGEAADVEGGKGVDTCGFAGVEGTCNT